MTQIYRFKKSGLVAAVLVLLGLELVLWLWMQQARGQEHFAILTRMGAESTTAAGFRGYLQVWQLGLGLILLCCLVLLILRLCKKIVVGNQQVLLARFGWRKVFDLHDLKTASLENRTIKILNAPLLRKSLLLTAKTEKISFPINGLYAVNQQQTSDAAAQSLLQHLQNGPVSGYRK